jgi:hypothetical protein
MKKLVFSLMQTFAVIDFQNWAPVGRCATPRALRPPRRSDPNHRGVIFLLSRAPHLVNPSEP